MALTERQWQTIERRSGVPRHVMQVLLNRGERSAQSSVSPMGAYGRAQLMPQTARNLERKYKISTKGEFGNVLVGALYLGEQKRAFGNWRKAFAAYNAGPGAVKKYGGVPPYKETRDYVQRTMAALGSDAQMPVSAPGKAPRRTRGIPGIPGVPGIPGISGRNATAFGVTPNYAKIAQQSMLQAASSSDDYDPLDFFQQLVSEKQRAANVPRKIRIPGVPGIPGIPGISGRSGRSLPVQIQGKATPQDAKAIRLAQHYLGTPYSWGGGGPSGPTKGIGRGAGTVGFDCSGLIEYVWAKQGIQVGGTTYEQIKRGKAVNPSAKSLRPGDAVFFGDPQSPHHVGMYIGNGKFIESPHTGAVVRISKLAGRKPSAARRYG
jgi:cell wall-associated NlpC family hydrolase